MRQTLPDRELVRPVDDRPVVRLLPWLNVVSLGGHAVIDGGRAAIDPVLGELRAALGTHKMLILTGARIRARHVLGVGLELGLPTGALAALASTEAGQNGRLIAACSGPSTSPTARTERPPTSWRRTWRRPRPSSPTCGRPSACTSCPPPVGKIPPNRSDAGAFLLTDAYGAKRLVYIKGESGIHAGSDRIERVTASDLLSQDLAAIPVEPSVLTLLGRAKNVREFQVGNGLEPGTVTRALAGEAVGTAVTAD